MKTVKPQRLSLLSRTYEHRGACHFSVAAILFFDLEQPRRLLTDVSLWKAIAPELGKDAALDAAMPKARAEWLVTGYAFPPGGKPAIACAPRTVVGGQAKALHAIGDRACRTVLDVYEEVGSRELRNRIEHVQLLHPQDYGRLGKLGVIASMQPIHATSDMLMADKYWGRRSAGAYAWRTQLNAGARLAFGSDSPVESFNPFLGIHAAVTRRRADGSPHRDGWYPAQRLTVDEAVYGFTMGAAYASYEETRKGSLTPDKLADLIVLDRDIFTIDPMAIAETGVTATMIDGQWVWQS